MQNIFYNKSLLNTYSYTYNGVALHKWVAIAKQTLSEFNLSANFEYEPIWCESRKHFALEFVKKIYAAKLAADKNFEDLNKKMSNQHQGLCLLIDFLLRNIDT